MLRTWPSVPGCTSITLPIVHLPRIASLMAITTISLTSTFRLSLCHAYFVNRAGSTSLLQRFQKEATIFWTNSTRGRGFSVSFVSCHLVVPPVQSGEPAALRVSIVQSPVLHTFYHQHPVQLTLDTGATSNMVRASPAQLYGFPITPASQMARQADGVTPMDVIGEVHCSLTCGQWTFELDDLVVRQLDVDILANNPFMARNDNGVRPAKRQIEIGGTKIISYSSPSRHTRQPNVRRTQSFLLRSPNRTVDLPGEYLQFITPSDADSDTLWALEPRLDCPSNTQRKPEDVWPPPQQIQSVDHAVRVSNTTDSPILLKRGEHLCQARHILPVEASISTSPPNTCGAVSSSLAICKRFSFRVILDPDGCLDQDTGEKFKALNLEFDDVFNPSISKYNGASGKVEADVNIGSTPPPQRKGRLPQYNSNTLEELQAKFDELQATGVFAKPEQVNVHVEYLNTSSLFKQPNGGSRLVTSFVEVAQYSKPQASLMPNVDGVLHEIGLELNVGSHYSESFVLLQVRFQCCCSSSASAHFSV